MVPGYEVARHHVLIAEALTDLIARPGSRLLIVVPPRHGKSLLASILFPAWALGTYPWLRIIGSSHGDRLAYKFSRRARDTVAAPHWPFPDVTLSRSKAAAGDWDLAANPGGYHAAGVGGTITGEGADVLLIDDAIRSRADADSLSVRDGIWDWFTSDARPRLEPGGRIIIIGTRYHHDDLIGRAITEHPDWPLIHLEARCDHPDEDALGRAMGEALWPTRFDSAALSSTEKDVGTRTWMAEYQGRPAAETGAIVQASWFLRYDRPPDGILYTIASWDTAFKVGVGNDYTAMTVWGVTLAGAVLLYAMEGQYEFPDLIRVVKQEYRAWQPRTVLIEDKGSGQSLLQTLLHDEDKIPAVGVAVPAGDGKTKRLYDVTPMMEAGRVSIPLRASWLDPWLAELTNYPHAAHDDFVDSTSQALARIFRVGHAAGRATSDSYIPAGEPERRRRWTAVNDSP